MRRFLGQFAKAFVAPFYAPNPPIDPRLWPAFLRHLRDEWQMLRRRPR